MPTHRRFRCFVAVLGLTLAARAGAQRAEPPPAGARPLAATVPAGWPAVAATGPGACVGDRAARALLGAASGALVGATFKLGLLGRGFVGRHGPALGAAAGALVGAAWPTNCAAPGGPEGAR